MPNTKTVTPQTFQAPARLITALGERFAGKNEEAALIALSILSGMPLVLIGAPGTAKSAQVSDASKLVDAKYFGTQLNQHTTIDDIFGPLDIEKYKKGEYTRVTKGMLPEAEIVFLDEIFNAHPELLKTLLSVMQERRLPGNLWQGERLPLHTAISATNQIPEEETLASFYDRIALRHVTRQVPDLLWSELIEKGWNRSNENEETLKPVTTLEELKLLGTQLQRPNKEIEDTYIKFLKLLETNNNITVSDRRKILGFKAISWRAIMRGEAEPMKKDLTILNYIAPRNSEEMESVKAMLTTELKLAEAHMADLEKISAAVSGKIERMRSMSKEDRAVAIEVLKASKIKIKANMMDSGVDLTGNELNIYLTALNKLMKKIDDVVGEA